MPTEYQLRERLSWLRQETQLLFQRLYYFLVAIAFLVTAFAAIVSSDKFSLNGDNLYLLLIAFVICATGYLLSFFFAVVNHLSSVSIPKLGLNLYIESPHDFWDWTDMPWSQEHGVLEGRSLFRDIIQATTTPLDTNREKRRFAPHTYLVPTGFMILWVILWSVLVFCLPCVSTMMIYVTKIGSVFILFWLVLPFSSMPLLLLLCGWKIVVVLVVEMAVVVIPILCYLHYVNKTQRQSNR